MRAETAPVVALAVLLVATLPAGALGAGASVDAGAGDDRTVHMDVQLQPSGDAEWTVSTYVPLDDSNDRAAFRELGRKYVNGTAQLDTGVDTFRRVVGAVQAASGRPMRLSDVEREWAIRDGYGVLVLRFTWENFAREDGDRLVVDDAFQTSSGTWLSRLEDGQVLVVRPPEGVGFLETPRGKGVTNGTLRWEGPETLGEDYFRIVYRAEPGGPTQDPPGNGTPSDDPPTDTPDGVLPAGAYAVVSLLAVGAVAAYLLRRRRDGDGETQVVDSGGDAPAAGAATDGSETAGEPNAETPGDVDEAETGPSEPTPENPYAGVDVEMLSDEERVMRLLEANGGRMKQARIVKETDWSNAKVSQLLSAMDDEDAINKLRIGRENLISLPDVDLDSVEE